MPSFDQVARATAALVKGAKAVGIPIVITEQYPKGLGKTVPEIAEELPEGLTPIEKVCFSAPEAEGFDLAGRDQALVCGIEAHVCVNQTALDLLDEGVEVHVASDAVGSRFDENREIGLAKAERAGAVITSVETALFELVGRAGTESSSRCRGWSSTTRRTRHERVRAAGGRGALRRRAGRGRQVGRRRGGLQHRDDRLPGVGDRPLIRGPDHHLHLSADRQLRRRAGGDGVRSRPGARGDHARGQERGGLARGRGRVARLAARLRGGGHQRRRHAGSGAPHPRPGGDARRDLPRRSREAEARERVEAEPSMLGADLARTVTPDEPVELAGRGPARGRHRHRDQALDNSATSRAKLPVDFAPVLSQRTRCWRGTPTWSSSPTARATRRRSTTWWRRCASWSASDPCSASAWATSSSAARWASRPSSCPSATAAPTTRSRTWHAGGSTSPPRTTASRSRGRTGAANDGDEPIRWETDFGAAELSHLNLYDRTVEGGA